MSRWFAGYGAAALAFLVLDGIWLSLATPRLYRPAMGDLLAPRFSLAPAAAFYLIYIGGLLALAIAPALRSGQPIQALAYGAALGLVAYGTYDLTNLATMRGFPTHLALIDLAWGTIASAGAAYAGVVAMMAMARSG